MKNKKLIIVVLAFIALVGLVAGLWFGSQNRPPKDELTPTGDGFTVVVVHADKTEKEFYYHATNHPDITKLGDFLEAEGLIESEGADDGMFHTVDGEKADWNENQSYWAFYIGDDYAMTGIYDTDIECYTTYKLVYTIG